MLVAISNMSKALAKNSGLPQGLEQSGAKVRGKGITKEGRRELRCLPCLYLCQVQAGQGGAGRSGLAGGLA